MKHRAIYSKIVYCVFTLVVAVVMLGSFTGCGKKQSGSDDKSDATKQSVNGEVKSADDFAQIGVYINVGRDDVGITDVKYRISGEIAIVDFRYNGVRVELRGSCKYSQYDLAGVKDTSNGDLIATDVEGYSASLYTLDPGRVMFWSDGEINYSLYVYVTATDDVVNDILTHISFESRYDERADVQDQLAGESKVFAQKVIQVFNDKDMEALEDMMYYPQELGNGHSVANRNELLDLSSEDMFTDILIKALNEDNALDNMRKIDDEFIIGTNYKNVHFKMMKNGQFLITKINN